MKAILIDDEESALSVLEILLKEGCEEISSIYKASNLEEGVELIKEKKPDIVFLDIEMPEHSGLEILDFFEAKEIDFQIIFVTAYSEYALKAFEMSAIGYILKPINLMQLQKVIKKCSAIKDKESYVKELNSLRRITMNTLALEVPNGILFLSYDDILYFEADGSYTKVYLNNGKVELICKSLKYFDDQLFEIPFFYRSHRSYFVNLKYVKQFVKLDGGYLIMKNEINLPISKNKKEELFQMIQKFF